MEIPKEVYEHLTNFADDKTILNMLSVNKKFRDEQFFERVMKRKYPELIQYKTDDETWKSFYIKMVYYIAKLKEKFRFYYDRQPGYNPEKLYLVKKLRKLYEKSKYDKLVRILKKLKIDDDNINDQIKQIVYDYNKGNDVAMVPFLEILLGYVPIFENNLLNYYKLI
jgi:hypothetical protein